MSTDLAEKILLGFLAVDSAINALGQHVLFDLNEAPIWAYDGENGFNDRREAIIHALKHFGPTAGLSAKETFSCPGAVASNEQTLSLIMHANIAKEAFKKVLSECRAEMRHQALPFVHNILSRSGFTAIKLQQVTRSIPFINYHPRRIGWSCVKHSSNKLCSTKELEKALLAAGEGEHIDIQLEKLNALCSSAPLVVYREMSSLWQVNVTSFKQEGRSSFNGQRTSLPLFYLHDAMLTLPIVELSNAVNHRKTRADKRIEDQPYIPSIHAYRQRHSTYLNE